MRDAIAELDWIEPSDVLVDKAAKTVKVGLDDGEPGPEAIVAHFADIRQYKLRLRP